MVRDFIMGLLIGNLIGALIVMFINIRKYEEENR